MSLKPDSIIESKHPDLYKNIFLNEDELTVYEYFPHRYKSNNIERTSIRLEVPLWPDLVNGFNKIQENKGKGKFYDDDKFEGRLLSAPSARIERSTNEDVAFEFPVEHENNNLTPLQRTYIVSNDCHVVDCDECDGAKYVTCRDYTCEGRHEWDCPTCNKAGKIPCENCHVTGKVTCKNCGGDGQVKCGSMLGSGIGSAFGTTMAGCNGSGHIYVTKPGSKTGQKVQRKCTKCHGKGYNKCSDCTKGQITCPKCSGAKNITCPECDGRKTIVCAHCYGDKERYGKIDCPKCEATGKLGYAHLVTSRVINHDTKSIAVSGNSGIEGISESQVWRCVENEGSCELVYLNLSDQSSSDEPIVNWLTSSNRSSLGTSQDDFAIKTFKEELFHTKVLCGEGTYTHILTGKSYRYAILGYGQQDIVHFWEQPDKLEKQSGWVNFKYNLGNFFGKLLKTKTWKANNDDFLENKLLVRLIRADGVIDVEEKKLFTQKMVETKSLTNAQKLVLFELLNASTILPVTQEEVKFSSAERFEECIGKLNMYAEADGDASQSELDLITEIKSTYGQ